MARRGTRTLGMPLPISGKFLPALILIIIGLGLMIFQSLTQQVRGPQDLVLKEATLSNYSFKKTPEGERDYGIWLKEFSERFELAGPDEASFDTTAFKAAVKPGERLRVEYNTRENVLQNGGLRRLYGLSVPSKNLTFFLGEKTVKQENTGVLHYITYALIAAGIGLYIWQIIKIQRHKKLYQDDPY